MKTNRLLRFLQFLEGDEISLIGIFTAAPYLRTIFTLPFYKLKTDVITFDV